MTKQLPKASLDVEAIRKDFPILSREMHGKPLIYLDSAATTQKPQCVLDAMTEYYVSSNANVHRGVHLLSMEATDAFELARQQIQNFLGAQQANEIVFVRGATEAINLVANSFVRENINAGDEILVTEMEHHSNIVPWQMLCKATGAELRVLPITDEGVLRTDLLTEMLTDRTRIMAVTHVSNVLGTINPIKTIVQECHARGVPVLVDGAQGAVHQHVDVVDLDCDFYVISGHKMYGPTGIGALYAKKEHLENMVPYQGGGEMILSVSFDKTVYAEPPARFEAGTPDIAGAIGLGRATAYLQELGLANIEAWELELGQYAREKLGGIQSIRMFGPAQSSAAVVSFLIGDVHPHDVGTILDQAGIAVRTGHHCAQPLMERFGIAATVRASFGVYNTMDEIDSLCIAIDEVNSLFNYV